MWDDPAASAPDPGDPELLAPTSVPVAWTQDQLLRLENEWRRLQRSFAYHSAVRIQPLHGDPPDEYQIDFQVRTLIVDESGGLAYAENCPIHIWLPPGFPHHPPLVRPMIGVFHPNVTLDAIYLSQPWTPTTTLADLVPQIGEVLTFRTYEPAVPWNPAALDYIYQNPQVVPTDAAKDFGMNAGGDPLERICRHGTPLIAKIRGQLDEVCDALATGEAPDESQVGEFAKRIRLTLGLFLEDDVPDSLRGPASELDEFARELALSTSLFAAIREQREAGKKAAHAAHAMHLAREMLADASRVLDKLVRPAEVLEAQQLLKQIPDPGTLQHQEGTITTLLLQARQRAADVEARLLPLEGLGRVPVMFTSLVGLRLDLESDKALRSAEDGREKALGELGRSKPMFQRAQERLEGLKRIEGWREYSDLVAKAHDLERKLAQWGSAGIEAYFIQGEDGRFGPFAFEMPLVIGAHTVAVRNPAGAVIEVIDALTGDLRAHNDNGTTVLTLANPKTNHPANTGVQLTPRCDELAVQITYLIAQTRETLPKLIGPIAAGECWLTWFNDALTSANAQQALRQAQEQNEKTWQTLVADLESLAPFKQRVATYYLLERVAQAAPKLNARLDELKNALAAATGRIATIVSGSSTNIDTGQLQVPAKFAKEYPEQLVRRDRCNKDIPRIQRRIDRAIAEVKRRIESADLLGLYRLPTLGLLPGLSADLLEIQPSMSPENLRVKIAELQQLLRTELKLAAPAAVEPEPPPPVVHAEVAAEVQHAGGEFEEEESAGAEEYVDFTASENEET